MRQLVRSRGFVSGARESARREVSVSGARRDEDRRGRAYLAGLSGGASCFASGSGSYATRMSPFAHSAAISSVSAALSWGLGVRSTLVVGVDFVSGSRISAAEGDRTREGAEHGRHGAASRQSRWTMDLEDTRTSEPPRPACTPRAASGTPCLRASRDGMCAEANASAAFLTSFSFTIRRRDDSSYPIRRSGRFALRRLNTARHITRYLATFTPSLPPRASRPVSPPAPPSTPGRRA
jgi:hypothetical protein